MRVPRVSQEERARRGVLAEAAAAAYLEARGYTLLERNLRVGRLEVDIVARLGEVVALVEVRTRGRGAWQTPLATVRGAKEHRLRRAGTILWARRFCRMPGVERLRFDVAGVDLTGPTPVVEHIAAAF